MGNGNLLAQFSPNMNYIAVIGLTNNLKILDRKGQLKKELPLNSRSHATSLEWDMDSDTVSVVCVVQLYSRKSPTPC